MLYSVPFCPIQEMFNIALIPDSYNGPKLFFVKIYTD